MASPSPTLNPAIDSLQSSPLGQRRALICVCIATLVVKIAVFATSLASIAAAPRVASVHSTGIAMFAWDSLHYRSVLVHGYPPANDGGTAPYALCFFPLYPMLSRVPAMLLSPEAALLVVSNLCSVAGIGFAWLWARSVVPAPISLWSALLLVCFPASMFLSAAYSEGMFLLFAALALWFTARRRFFGAALACAAGTATRPTGLALALTLGALWMLSTRFSQEAKPRLIRIAALMLLSIAGIAAYATFIQVRYGSALAYFDAQKQWSGARAVSRVPANGSAISVPVRTADASSFRLVQKVTSLGAWNKVFAWGIFGVSLAGLLGCGPAPRAYFLLPLLIFLLGYVPDSGARITSIARFETAAVPVFVFAAYWLNRVGGGALLAGSCLGMLAGQIIYAWSFSQGVWCG